MSNEINTSSVGLQKQDYALATSCGILSGLIDAIFVGNPNDSKLLQITDKLADKFVVKSAQFFWKHDKRTVGKNKTMPTDLETCISYLEQAFPVDYDARYAKDLKVDDGVLEHMNPSNHHILSLSHSPDLVGLAFSIIDQFSEKKTESFWDKGKIIHVAPKKESKNPYPYFYGADYQSKIFCGFINWIGHLLSDVVGSSSTRKPGKDSRGRGIVMPFYTLTQAFDWGDFNGETFADIMRKVYEDGYDSRFGMTTAIPVVINDLLTKTIWIIRQRTIKKKDWKECLPSSKDGDYRLFLILANTSFELVDCVDAAIHSVNFKSGIDINWVGFFSNINFTGLMRLSGLVLRESIIRLGLSLNDNTFDDTFQRCTEKMTDNVELADNALSETIKAYFECLDYKKKLCESLAEYKEAKNQRIEIERQVEKSIESILRFREKMYQQMEAYFEEYLTAFDEGITLIDKGIVDNESDVFISGNSIIQNKLEREQQFDSQKEFDEMMDSDEDFIF